MRLTYEILDRTITNLYCSGGPRCGLSQFAPCKCDLAVKAAADQLGLFPVRKVTDKVDCDALGTGNIASCQLANMC